MTHLRWKAEAIKKLTFHIYLQESVPTCTLQKRRLKDNTHPISGAMTMRPKPEKDPAQIPHPVYATNKESKVQLRWFTNLPPFPTMKACVHAPALLHCFVCTCRMLLREMKTAACMPHPILRHATSHGHHADNTRQSGMPAFVWHFG